MNHKLLGALSAACISLLLTACGSDNSASAEDEYSSSVIASSSSSVIANSSSSVIANSSSSVIANEVKQSSSSEVASSSSSPRNDNSSSSSETTQSSSSTAAPCNVDGENNCNYGTLTDTRDGKIYKTVTIGDQTWMAENLNYAYTGVPYEFIDGSEVYVSDSMSWCYDNDPDNCTKYGRLYTWAAAMDSVGTWSTNGKGCGYMVECSPTYPVQGICPEGWHLPSKMEFNALFATVGGKDVASTILKSTSGWYTSDSKNGNGTDAFGFSALPAGYREYDGYYGYVVDRMFFWSSTEDDIYSSHEIYMDYNYDKVFLSDEYKGYGYSVRCLKD